MAKMTLKQKISIEYSYSFQWGNTLREAMIKPWRLPILPYSLWKKHRLIQQYRKNTSSLTPYLFVIDYQKFSSEDRIQFQTFFNSLPDCEILIIGDEHVEAASHHFPSSRSSSKDKRQWNEDLQRLLTVVVESSRPEKFVFIGQYPYAGVMGVLRTLEPRHDTAWLPIRAKKETVDERRQAFGHLLNWPQSVTGNWNLSPEMVHISENLHEDLKETLRTKINQYELVEGPKLQSKILFLDEDDTVDKHLEEKQCLAVTMVKFKPRSGTNIIHPANHVLMYPEDKVYFESQLDSLLENISNDRFPGSRISMVEEKAWVDTYSSF